MSGTKYLLSFIEILNYENYTYFKNTNNNIVVLGYHQFKNGMIKTFPDISRFVIAS